MDTRAQEDDGQWESVQEETETQIPDADGLIHSPSAKQIMTYITVAPTP